MADFTKIYIDGLLSGQVAEGKTIDYKLALPGNSDAERREFLADTSSFANAGGGELAFGVEESGGVPVNVPGLATRDADAEIARLVSMVQSGMAPRIAGIEIKAVPGFAQGPVILMRIPKSWGGPHMVTFGGSSKFYTRNSSGKHQMDVGEIRASFALAESLPERIRQFRTDRVGNVVAGETPMSLQDGAKMVLHIVPVSAFTSNEQISPAQLRSKSHLLNPIGGSNGHRFNMDGFVSYLGDFREQSGFEGYCQVFRSGIIESVDTSLLAPYDGRKAIPSTTFEESVLRVAEFYFKALGEFEISPPFIVMLGLLGVRGYSMGVNQRFGHRMPTPIDRDNVLSPEIVVDEYGVSPQAVMKPIFDAIWNATGFERSFNYNEQGEWKPQ